MRLATLNLCFVEPLVHQVRSFVLQNIPLVFDIVLVDKIFRLLQVPLTVVDLHGDSFFSDFDFFYLTMYLLVLFCLHLLLSLDSLQVWLSVRSTSLEIAFYDSENPHFALSCDEGLVDTFLVAERNVAGPPVDAVCHH